MLIQLLFFPDCPNVGLARLAFVPSEMSSLAASAASRKRT
jgi:hypothetical protein